MRREELEQMERAEALFDVAVRRQSISCEWEEVPNAFKPIYNRMRSFRHGDFTLEIRSNEPYDNVFFTLHWNGECVRNTVLQRVEDHTATAEAIEAFIDGTKTAMDKLSATFDRN